MIRTLLAWAAFTAVLAPAAPGQDAPTQPVDKAGYTLLNPTPRELWREMETDRPDVTESPRTVDAGAVQLELSFIEWTRDSERGARSDTFAFAPLNLKLGLLNNTDLQLVLAPYAHENPSPGDTAGGVGDLTLRLKVNLWGNDGGWGGTALGIMPFVMIPTGDVELSGATDHVQGGLIIPFACELAGGFSLGLMAEFDFNYSEMDDEYQADFVHTAAVGRTLIGELAGYIEYIGVAALDSGRSYAASMGMGLTYALSPDVQLDGGAIFGLTERTTEDVTLFAGISLRF